mmetsp:Transcript_12209/g.22891  ORF Transcript_12209/g.22891 Transcript_12209/m.22891 type:complete len:811 (-) Transcript_12209:45-2477(-)
MKHQEETKFVCKGCNQEFASKSALFRHLRASGGKCFPPEEHENFLKYFVNAEENREKIIILYGYVPGDYYLNLGLRDCNSARIEIDPDSPKYGVCNGDHVAELVQEAIEIVSNEADIDNYLKLRGEKSYSKCNRSFGFSARATELCQQDECTGALTEVMTGRAPKLFIEDCPVNEKHKREEEMLAAWVQKINSALDQLILQLDHPDNDGKSLGKVRVFGRLQAPKKFNAEMDVNHRRIDYLLPADLLYGVEQSSSGMTLQEFLESIKESHPNRNTENHGPSSQNSDSKQQNFSYISKLKKLMQKFCSQVIEVDGVSDNDRTTGDTANDEVSSNQPKQVRMQNACTTATKCNVKEDAMIETEGYVSADKGNNNSTKKRVLKRKLYHNFSRTAVAHDFLSFRRVDRFFHRATIRCTASSTQKISTRPFIVISAKGDLFLNGQFRGMIGLLIAIVRGLVDESILDCVFDEEYPNLVPCPFAPTTGLFQGEVNYATWEGKMNSVLTPRKSERWQKGWKSDTIINCINDFEDELCGSIARVWAESGEPNSDVPDMESVSTWITSYLEPWAKRANEQLRNYQRWKALKNEIQQNNCTELALIEKLTPPLSSMQDFVPPLYQKVLELLREADRSGSWPSTSPKRQLVMVSTPENEAENDNIQSDIERPSAYNFFEGQGGASGSFSVGATPGQGCELPKGNALFPELMNAAFELEIALCPDRIPSSTIAINRNAQFRPHIDNGVGAIGQSRSLIVGLGKYSGGELMVEGEKYDIRYNPIEFNGWTDRHWTCPFLGERYSLVWFTPKGCEGIRGLDLCQ